MAMTRLGHLRLARPEDDEMKDSKYSVFGTLVAGLAVVGLLVLLTKLVYVKAQPEATPLNVPAKAEPVRPDVKVQELLPAGKVGWGLHRVQVDGRTFLLWANTHGAAIVEYEPVEETRALGVKD